MGGTPAGGTRGGLIGAERDAPDGVTRTQLARRGLLGGRSTEEGDVGARHEHAHGAGLDVEVEGGVRGGQTDLAVQLEVGEEPAGQGLQANAPGAPEDASGRPQA